MSEGMSEGYVGKLCRKAMSEGYVGGDSRGYVGRYVGSLGQMGAGRVSCSYLTQPQEVTRDPRPPKDGTEPQCFALRRSGLEPSREWGPGYVGGMSEVCRTRGLWVSPPFNEAFVQIGR